MSRLLILFGSQTGYCQETAERIQREGRQRHFAVELLPMDKYVISNLPNEQLVVLVCSVTGQGEEPDTMKAFWKYLLRKSLASDSLSLMHFGVFGQGDSSYAKFNYPAKKLHKRLIQLGAHPLLPCGDGDDQHYLGVDGALDPWLTSFWDNALSLFPMPKGLEIIPANILPPSTYAIEMLDSECTNSVLEVENGEYKAQVKTNKLITAPTHFQDIRHFEFTVDDNEFQYAAGDIMVIYPQNLSERVKEVLEYFGWSDIADRLIEFKRDPEVKGHTIPAFLQKPITLRELFEKHLDIFGRPRRYFFQLLAFFATDPLQIEKLEEFSSTEGQNDLYLYAHKMKRTMFEVLQDFNSVKLPIKYLPDVIGFMRTRAFSISSAPSIHPKEIHLTAGIVKFKTRLAQPRLGVCTNWLAQIKIGDVIKFGIQRGTFRLPALNSHHPIICIGPGTGVAPMRSLILEYHQLSPSVPKILIFGNRNRKNDFLYENDWNEIPNLRLITAFSRDQDDKIYVQHKIEENGELLWNMIHNQSAHIYLSGNAKRMPIDVAEAFVKIIGQFGNLSEDMARKYFKNLEKTGHFQQECWS
ncbi:hypothetical protein BC833DRAFT_625093 [Globomyces pollinis-pini]|nr:hypothetical protein BC833DRAFT_625093 [Globomyces pollinis-pini]